MPCTQISDEPGYLPLDYEDLFDDSFAMEQQITDDDPDATEGMYISAQNYAEHAQIRQENALCPRNLSNFGTAVNSN